MALIAFLFCIGGITRTAAQSIPSLNGCACDSLCFFGGGVYVGPRRWCYVIESTCGAGVPYRDADGRGWDVCPNSATSTMYTGPTLSAVTATGPPRSTVPHSVKTTPFPSPTPSQAASTMLAADTAVVASDDNAHTIQIVGICAGVAGALVAVVFIVGGTMWAKKERRKSIVRDLGRDDLPRLSSSRLSFENRPTTSTPSLLSPTPGSTPPLLSPTPLPMSAVPDPMLYSRIASPTPIRALSPEMQPVYSVFPGPSHSPTPPISRDMTPTPPLLHSPTPTAIFLHSPTPIVPDDDDGIVVPPRTGSLALARRVMRASLDERRDMMQTSFPSVLLTGPSPTPTTPPISREPTPMPTPTPAPQIIQEATPVTTEDEDDTVIPPRTGSLILSRRIMRASLDERRDFLITPPPSVVAAMRAAAATTPALDGVSIKVGDVIGRGAVRY
ncbi:hypothetical protein M427DRAFT_154874 [Gonapodya prolifera JEL478]|uniref:Uncharacterized protein n=1 Tax=Gonapodya prolifera (strain JEL478) TaxID=1344416 RepID=A0A139AHY5_GONPJ|nr:hypothetical protein M427DRAFT_154874 [Gonapodya prolifera JEL478]|eukprot:KXS16164.1 hypothetical protein M427DRAFT_154874 [Gonapodya prolifera JEL478]